MCCGEKRSVLKAERRTTAEVKRPAAPAPRPMPPAPPSGHTLTYVR